MANQNNLADHTVAELKDIADSEGIDVPHNATKAEIIDAIEAGRKEAGKSEAAAPKAAKPKGPTFNAPDPTLGILSIDTKDLVTLVFVTGAKAYPDATITPSPYPGVTNPNIVYARSGVAGSWMTPADAANRFAADINGQIWFSVHGLVFNENYKPVDIFALLGPAPGP